MSAKETGSFLSELREQKGLKQKEVAEAIHVSDKAISRWETGRGIPDINSLQSLSDFYEVSINEILEGRRLKEGEMKKVADQNLKESVTRETRLKIFSGTAIIGMIVCISCMIFVLMMPQEGSAMTFASSDVDKVFELAADLENAGVEYSVSLEPGRRIVIHIEDMKAYDQYVTKMVTP